MENNEVTNAVNRIFCEMLKDPDIRQKIRMAVSDKPQGRSLSIFSGKEGRGDISSEYSSMTQSSTQADKSDSVTELLKEIRNIENALLPSMENKIVNEIRSAIEERFSQVKNAEAEKLNEENRLLKEENTKLRNSVADLKNRAEAFENERANIRKKYESFSGIMSIWEKLNQLNEQTRKYIGELCGSFDLYACLSLGRDFGKINQLWGYLNNCANSADNNRETVNILNDYFEFCIHTANSTRSAEERYSFFEPTVGTALDMDRCIKTSYSKQVGTVKRVISKGVLCGDKVVYKAIAEIG